jgi:hypothetical protein
MREYPRTAALVDVRAAMHGQESWSSFLAEVRRLAPNGRAFLIISRPRDWGRVHHPVGRHGAGRGGGLPAVAAGQ